MIGSKNSSSDGRKKTGTWKVLLLSLIFIIIIFFSSLAEVTFLSAFGMTPALTLSIICAVGFIFGEKFGAIFGIVGGILIDCFGGSPLPLSPVLYMMCGYMCGVAVGWFLSSNFPSFIVYSLIAGVLREIFSVISVALISNRFDLWKIVTDLLIPEYLAYIICTPFTYFAVWVINCLFKGKNSRVKQK